MSSLANHLWQSTFFALFAALAALALRRHRAQTRYWIWLAASIKFAVPFSWLIGLGAFFDWRHAPPVRPALAPTVQQLSQPFAPVPPIFTSSTPSGWAAVALAVWASGAAILLACWAVRWLRVHRALRSASRLAIDAPVPVWSSTTRLEPGVFGIFRPVLLVPAGLADRLSPAQFRAILAHELCHVRRRDNLAALFHMLVEAAFWFHPLVWWIGARLMEERECACDQEVLRLGGDPEAYATGILDVCRMYLESPLPCASGVTGADLKKRIASIVMPHRSRTLTPAAKAVLAAAAALAIAIPVMLGVLHAQDKLKFDVASVKPADRDARGMRFSTTPAAGLEAHNVTLRTLIEYAYNVRSFQISGGPDWMANDRWELLAKPDPPEPAPAADIDKAEERRVYDRIRERTRMLLAERFHLAVRRESRDLPVYHLTIAKGGHKLQPATEKGGITRDLGRLTGKSAEMENFAVVLSFVLGRPVIDQTGIAGRYDFDVKWSEEFDGRQIGKEKGIAIPPDAHPPDGPASDPGGPSLFTALEKQLGLKLESAKGPVDIIVVDRAERPTAN